MRYTPFGSYRLGNPSQLTDRAYTGQRENMDLGLYYYNARYYLPGAGRFLSADTLVPDPQNPQLFNRYAYSLNSPLNYSDPTGHCPNKIIVCIITGGETDGRKSKEKQYDLTAWLGREMVSNLRGPEMELVQMLAETGIADDPRYLAMNESMSGSFLAYQGAWFDLTRDYGVWDLKRNMQDVIGDSIVLCGEVSCGWFDYSVPGNIHYGFLAAAAGIPRGESYWAAGMLELVGTPFGQGDPGDFSTGFENPADKAAVEFGYNLFDKYGYDLTPADLMTELTPKVMSMLQKPENIPLIPAGHQPNSYPPGVFDYGR